MAVTICVFVLFYFSATLDINCVVKVAKVRVSTLVIPNSHLHESTGDLVVRHARHGAVEIHHLGNVQVVEGRIHRTNHPLVVAVDHVAVHSIHTSTQEHVVHGDHDLTAGHHFWKQRCGVLVVLNYMFVECYNKIIFGPTINFSKS